MNKTDIAKRIKVKEEHLSKIKHAVEILQKALTDPIVRGTATQEYVEDHLFRGRALVERLESDLIQLRKNAAPKID